MAELENTAMPVALAFKVNKVRRKLMDSYEDYLKTLEPIKNDEEKVQELLGLESEVSAEKIGVKELLDSCISLSPKAVQGFLPVLEE